MSYLIVLCVVAVEALSLAVLWIAVRVNIPRVVRPLVAVAGLSGAWGAWILVLVLHGPLSMLAFTVAVFAVSSVTMGISIHLATVEQDDPCDGGSGGPPAADPESPAGGGDDEPLWWPDFEREIAAYADQPEPEPDRELQPIDC